MKKSKDCNIQFTTDSKQQKTLITNLLSVLFITQLGSKKYEDVLKLSKIKYKKIPRN